MGEGWVYTRRARLARGFRLMGTLALGSLCAACQASLDLEEYSFKSGEPVAPYDGMPAGDTSGTQGSADMGGSGGSSFAGPPPMGDNGGASGSGTAAALGGNGGAPPVTPAGSGGGTNLKLCPDQELLIDDMEDDPAWLCPHYGRGQNAWYIVVGPDDGSLSATFSPEPFAYATIPGGRMGSQRGIHAVIAALDADDFAGFGVNFSPLGGTRPFDASGYGGVSLYARGSGTVQVRLPTAETIPVDRGGRCDEDDPPCYNDHHVLLELTDSWQLYQYSFAEFMPPGYGPPRDFSPTELFGLMISQAPGQTDLDIWIDDIWFLPGSTAQ